MKGVSYVTNINGENTALLIDLELLKKVDTSDADINDFLDDLDDLVAIELSKGKAGRPYHEVRNEILNAQRNAI